MRTHVSLILILLLLAPLALFAADLTIDMQVKLSGPDDANNYLTFKGGNNSVDKDQFDTATGASKHLSTDLFNSYRRDVQGKTTMPSGIRSLLLYAISGNETRVKDDLSVARDSNGVYTIRFVHRGTAYEMVSDRNGKLSLTAPNYKIRKIGDTGNNIHPDFSRDGKAAGVDWAKVWNASVKGGAIGNTTTGNIANDAPASAFYYMAGDLQVSVVAGGNLKVTGELNAVKK